MLVVFYLFLFEGQGLFCMMQKEKIIDGDVVNGYCY